MQLLLFLFIIYRLYHKFYINIFISMHIILFHILYVCYHITLLTNTQERDTSLYVFSYYNMNTKY